MLLPPFLWSMETSCKPSIVVKRSKMIVPLYSNALFILHKIIYTQNADIYYVHPVFIAMLHLHISSKDSFKDCGHNFPASQPERYNKIHFITRKNVQCLFLQTVQIILILLSYILLSLFSYEDLYHSNIQNIYYTLSV